MQSLARNGFTKDEVLAALRSPNRRWSFRYELLDDEDNRIGDIDNVIDGEVSYNHLADIKRTARFTVRDDGSINYLSDRIKPYARLHMTRGYKSVEKVETFTADGSWEAPEGVHTYVVEAWGGGATGGQTTTGNNPMGGGGAGAYASSRLKVTEHPSVSFTIGQGGVVDRQATSGTPGGDTAVETNLIVAAGGDAAVNETGGIGGQAADSIGDTVFSGGDGGDSLESGTGTSGGGGGGSAFDDADGGDGETPSAGGIGGLGGDGEGRGGAGSGSDDADPSPQDGQAPGAGGGGTHNVDDVNGVASGDGADGQVTIRYFVTVAPKEQDYVEWPLGVFLLSTPAKRANEQGTVTREIEAYDKLLIYRDDRVADRYSVSAGTLYTDAVSDLLGNVPVDFTPSTLTLPVTKEWDAGTTKLSIINELLNEINYESLYFNPVGSAVVQPYQTPQDRPSEHTYETGPESTLLMEAERHLDLFDIPNRWVLVVSDPERAPISGVYTNSDPASPTSTVNRGRTIVDFREQEEAADQSTLDARAERLAFEASQVYESVEFETGLAPYHAHKDVYTLKHPVLNIDAKYTEHKWTMQLQAGSTMSHRIRRIITI